MYRGGGGWGTEMGGGGKEEKNEGKKLEIKEEWENIFLFLVDLLIDIMLD